MGLLLDYLFCVFWVIKNQLFTKWQSAVINKEITVWVFTLPFGNSNKFSKSTSKKHLFLRSSVSSSIKMGLLPTHNTHRHRPGICSYWIFVKCNEEIHVLHLNWSVAHSEHFKF